MSLEGRRIEIRGTVQGVGFRPWVYRLARELGIGGRVRNDRMGVTIEAFGRARTLEEFLRRLSTSAPPAAAIATLRWQAIPSEECPDFAIAPSDPPAERRVSIPPDLATCSACLAELFEPGNRRYRYPFTNCTDCGPRFTIALDLPYDRALTTMARFPMCPACRREYESVEDRRFHAEPNACPACGPTLRALSARGEDLRADDPIALAARAIASGRIVAVKGIGGFHLACDATSPEAVRELRRRKARDRKPFALMVRDLATARRLADLGDEEVALLTCVVRPIVLVPRRAGAAVAEEVAPSNPLLGLMLPYSPLHHLLLAEVDRPLVMTSGNLANEPIAYRDDDALRRLGAIADLFLVHDREIAVPTDDSVARVVARRPVVFRRSRGYVPRPIAIEQPFSRPVLAVGAHLKNACCIGVGDTAWLGPHVGDLENLETIEAFEDAVRRMERFLRVRPEVIAHDLHPDIPSTAYALARPEAIKVAVQHHHAHVASAMAEHGLRGPVLGVAFDGTGHGSDGTAWGGEFLVAQRERFERVATFRAVALAGGDQAIRQVWRIALALLDDAFEGAPPLERLAVFRAVAPERIAAVRRMIATGLNSPRAHGVGRFFDALGAIGLGLGVSHHEGEVALRWNLVADASEPGAYPYDVADEGPLWLVDLRPLVRTAVEDLLRGISAAIVSARFHNALVAATVDVVRRIRAQRGPLPVVLTGGCFQNARMAEGIAAALSAEATVYLHGQVPPGDGGIALGQAVVADAVVRGGA